MDQIHKGTYICVQMPGQSFSEASKSQESALPFHTTKVQAFTDNLHCFLSGYRSKLQFDLKGLFQTKRFYGSSRISEFSASSLKLYLHRTNTSGRTGRKLVVN